MALRPRLSALRSSFRFRRKDRRRCREAPYRSALAPKWRRGARGTARHLWSPFRLGLPARRVQWRARPHPPAAAVAPDREAFGLVEQPQDRLVPPAPPRPWQGGIRTPGTRLDFEGPEMPTGRLAPRVRLGAWAERLAALLVSPQALLSPCPGVSRVRDNFPVAASSGTARSASRALSFPALNGGACRASRSGIR